MFSPLPISTGVGRPLAWPRPRAFFFSSSVPSSFLRALRVNSFFFLAIFSLLLLPEGALSAAIPQTPPASPAQPKNSQPPAGAPAAKSSGKTPSKASSKAHSAKHHSSKKNSKSGKGRQRAQRAPTPERISEVQSALAHAGHYSGRPTGKWDASTVQAMKNYQQASGLPATGKLDARTLQKLGLGSPIAGVAPPRPPAPARPAASVPPAATTPSPTTPATPHP